MISIIFIELKNKLSNNFRVQFVKFQKLFLLELVIAEDNCVELFQAIKNRRLQMAQLIALEI